MEWKQEDKCVKIFWLKYLKLHYEENKDQEHHHLVEFTLNLADIQQHIVEQIGFQLNWYDS